MLYDSDEDSREGLDATSVMKRRPEIPQNMRKFTQQSGINSSYSPQ